MFPLRPFQKNAIDALQVSRHVLCVAPTGSGKSLIFERFARDSARRTLLITPLVALGRQQAQRLSQSLGGPVEYGGATLPGKETRAWIISPETLETGRTQDALKHWGPDFLVVDECHCLWEWGQEFRPAFRAVPKLLSLSGLEKSLWLTATLPADAREQIRNDVLAHAGMPVRELGCFQPPESLHLSLVRVPWIHRTDALLHYLRALAPEPGLIFLSTRSMAERVCELLRAAGESAAYYHAGLSQEERRALEQRISEQALRVVVCTSAFGMGMDFSHLRWTVLWQAPPSLLALAQSAGRVGRSGARGRTIAFWDPDDFKLLEWIAARSERGRKELARTSIYYTTAACRWSGLAAYFDGESRVSCPGCDFCGYSQFI